MRGKWGAVGLMWIAGSIGVAGCGEDPPPAAAAPEAVTPVVVEPIAEGSPEGEEPLRARIAELEAELATCRGELPEGVEAVEVSADDGEGSTAAAAEGDDEPSEHRAARTERTRDRSLLGTLLGDEDPPRRRRTGSEDPEVIQVPNPAAILLGGE